jgi:fructose-1,6-bisphosphatase-3
MLAAHESFESTQKAIEEEIDIHSRTQILERTTNRKFVRNTDEGRQIQNRIDELTALLDAYRAGVIKENT